MRISASLVRGLIAQRAVRQYARVPRRIAAGHEGAIRRIVTRALTRARRPLSIAQVQQAVRWQSPDVLLAALFPVSAQWAVALGGLTPHFRDVYYEAWLAAERQARQSLRGAAFALPTDPYQEAVRWAESFAAELVVTITEETRQTIRVLVARAFSEGIPPRQLARLILQSTTLGLTPRSANAVLNLREAMARATEGQVVRYGTSTTTAPKGGFDDERIARTTERYAQRLLGQRALTIARTETIRAARQGQQAIWGRGLVEGWVGRGSLQRWSAAPDERTCPICQALDGQEVGMLASFVTINGAVLDGPPAHPNCRCSLVLVPEPFVS